MSKMEHRLNVTYGQGNSKIERVLYDLCRTDFADVDSDPFIIAHSPVDRHALNLIDKTAVRMGERGGIGLPWKSEDVNFPKNCNLAFKRLITLKAKIKERSQVLRKILRETSGNDERWIF